MSKSYESPNGTIIPGKIYVSIFDRDEGIPAYVVEDNEESALTMEAEDDLVGEYQLVRVLKVINPEPRFKEVRRK